jgi:8-oxo-dGTP pyrophosphatase MutT (NUDIX family)
MPKTEVGAGCAVAAFNKKREFFMLKRSAASRHMPGLYCLPGGWIEEGEAMLDAGRREIMEELGCRLGAMKAVGVADNIRPDEGHHTISALMVAMLLDGEAPVNREPDKADELFALPFSRWDSMPRPLVCDYAANMSRFEIEKFLDENA